MFSMTARAAQLATWSRVVSLVLLVGAAIFALRLSVPRLGLAGDPTIPLVKLNNGVEMPILAAGLWEVAPDEATAMVPKALKVGFNHIDASIYYGNQREVGVQLAKRYRADYFLTSKIDPSFIVGVESHHGGPRTGVMTAENGYVETSKQLYTCLTDLQTTYLDLVLVHWPQQTDCPAMQETWRAMEDFHEAGLARAVGVSNFCPSSLECIMQTAKVTPAVNQVGLHVGMGPDPGGVKRYCDEHGITLQAYSPLGAGSTGNPRTPELITGELVTSIGAKYGKSGAQVSLRWLVQHGIAVAAESTSEQHLAADLDIFDFALDAEDMATLDGATAPAAAYSFMCTK